MGLRAGPHQPAKGRKLPTVYKGAEARLTTTNHQTASRPVHEQTARRRPTHKGVIRRYARPRVGRPAQSYETAQTAPKVSNGRGARALHERGLRPMRPAAGLEVTATVFDRAQGRQAHHIPNLLVQAVGAPN